MNTETSQKPKCPQGGRPQDGACCYCQSKTVTQDAYGTVKARVAFCCWCSEDRPGRPQRKDA